MDSDFVSVRWNLWQLSGRQLRAGERTGILWVLGQKEDRLSIVVRFSEDGETSSRQLRQTDIDAMVRTLDGNFMIREQAPVEPDPLLRTPRPKRDLAVG